MNKLYITALHLLHGGVEMAITLQANAFVEAGYEVEILCSYNLGEPAYALNEAVKVTYLTDLHPNKAEIKAAIRAKNPVALLKEGLYAIKVLRHKKSTLIQKFREIQEGIILSTRNEHTVLLSRYGNPGVKKIAHLHHDHCFDKKLLDDFAKHYGNIDTFLLLTDRLTAEVKRVMANNTHTKVMTMPNFLDNKPVIENTVRQHQVIAVGRLHEVKGFDRLIRLWKEAAFAAPTVLKIVGDGDERSKLEALICELELQDRVVLTGALPHNEVMREMAQSLAYVMTSHTEGFGFVLVEAMQMGLPVVAYDVRVGPEAIIEDGKSGFLIPEDDEAAFRSKLAAIVNNEDLRAAMAQHAVARSEVFSKETIMKRWITVLEA